MANLFDRFKSAIEVFRDPSRALTVDEIAQLRAFMVGAGVVDNIDRAFGHDSQQYAPAEYGEYISTSNAVYACASLRADLISSLPIKFYKKQRNGKPTPAADGKAAQLLDWVNPFWSRERLMIMSELCLCLWGKNFWFIERGESGLGEPKEIWWAKADRVRVFPHPEKYIDHFEYIPKDGGAPLKFMPSETIWMRFPNPLDEFNGLSPLAAARLSADYASAAMKSNRNLFVNGLQMGGMVTPKAGTILSQEQATDLEEDISRRFKGVDKSHRWGVLRMEAQLQSMENLSPKDMEFSAGLRATLEDVCRAYKIPLDVMGGQRTYANVEGSDRALWTRCIQPEGRYIASELREQYLPMFPGEADLVEFDYSNVAILQADRGRWVDSIAKMMEKGVPLNKLLQEFMPSLLPEPNSPFANKTGTGWAWGDVWWAPLTLTPINDGEAVTPPAPAKEAGTDQTKPPARMAAPGKTLLPAPRAIRTPSTRAIIEYNSDEHQRLWNRFVRRTSSHEKRLGDTVADLFKRQQDSVLAKLRGRSKRDGSSVADEPFDMAQWVKAFRIEMRPLVAEIVADAGANALDDLSLALAFNMDDPRVVRFLERRAQRFAKEVNQTTWDNLKASLAEGINAGENISDLSARVETVMGDRIRSSGETIARTEVIGAMNGGTLEAWNQSGVVEKKAWLAALDDRTRETHLEAHTKYQGEPIPMDDDFEVGGGSGPAPGQIGLPEEDIQCRCTMTAVVK